MIQSKEIHGPQTETQMQVESKPHMLFQFAKPEFLHKPYPIGHVFEVFSAPAYAEMMQNWPETKMFKHSTGRFHKYALSELDNPENYHKFVNEHSIWSRLLAEVKSDEFIYTVLEVLLKNNIDLGLFGRSTVVNDRISLWRYKVEAALSLLKTGFSKNVPLKSRYEFSMLPPDGGSLLPHTDARQKLVTLVVHMGTPGEWRTEYGGGTSMVSPTSDNLYFNQINKLQQFDQVRTERTFEFHPNHCIIFVKTFNSWHAVQPIHAPQNVMRKSLTINIETLDKF